MKIIIGIFVILAVLIVWSICKVSGAYDEWADGNFDDWEDD